MTDAVEDIIGIGLRNPVRIVVNLKDKRTGEEAKERRTPMGYASVRRKRQFGLIVQTAKHSVSVPTCGKDTAALETATTGS